MPTPLIRVSTIGRYNGGNVRDVRKATLKMITTSRKIEIRDGKIELPEDLLEQSGIGTTDGTVIVALRASGEIVVRANASTRTDDPVGKTAGIFRKYAKNLPTEHMSTQEQIDAWKHAFEQGVADEVWQSMKDDEEGT